MDSGQFIGWAWSTTDEDKAGLADRIRKVRAGVDERFLREARFAAVAAIEGAGFDPYRANIAAAPEDALDEVGRDLEEWNRHVGNDIRTAYEDAMLALGAGASIGKGHRKMLAQPMLPEVPGLAQALDLA